MSKSAADRRYPWLETALDSEGVVITANRRLARELITVWGQLQLDSGRTTWKTPDIFSWQGWLTKLATSVADPLAFPRQLDSASATLLWERCLTQRMPENVLGINGVVRQAQASWSRANEWCVGIPALLSTAASADEKWFAAAAADYQDLLETGNWTDSAGVGRHLVNAIERGAVTIPPRVTVAGFDRLSPTADDVLQALSRKGCRIENPEISAAEARPAIAEFDNGNAELRAAGAWARAILEDNRSASIAIVCPGLETASQRVVRNVREGFLPGWQLGSPSLVAAAEVSYGKRLSEYPAIAAALTLLRWTIDGLSGAEVSQLLMSPFLRKDADGIRERMELSLREIPDRDWRASDFLDVNRRSLSDDGARHFRSIVACVHEATIATEQARTPAECIRLIDEFLGDCGWPGEQSLDSESFQLINRWRELLNEFARIESVVPTIGFRQAIRRLDSLAADTVWQPETSPGVVQILGPLEAAGMAFDAIWVAGMDAGSWPPPSRPAPFIAVELQRQRKMPDATPADTLAYARRTLRRLVSSAPNCVLGWSRAQDDTEQIRSSLLDEIPTSSYDGPGDPGWYATTLCGVQEIEINSDDSVRPVDKGERIWGGAYTVQRQFREPFSAFVFGRLGVERPERFNTGLSPGVRGNIIHNALHTLFSDKPYLHELAKWSDTEISRRTGAAVDTALAPHIRNADPVLSRLIGFERERVRGLLADFVASEADRDPDTQVVATELPLNFEVDSVKLGFRVDRIDRLVDGSLLIIDYKTGAPKHFLNKDDELRDVQPVLYADAVDETIGGLAFLNIDSRNILWKAAMHEPDKDDDRFTERLSGWIEVVRETVRAFAAGDVRINVLLNTAEARPLALLSRIEEQRREH